MSNERNLVKDGAREAQPRRRVAPAVDVFEGKNELLVLADVPGVKRDDVDVRFEKGELTISARRLRGGGSGEGVVEVEYRRSFLLPNGIDAASIEAELAGGVLKVRLPKSDALRPRQIPIRAA